MYASVITVLVLCVVSTKYILKSDEYYYLVLRIYNVLEYGLLAYLFFLYIRKKVIRAVLIFSLIPYTIFCVYDFIISKESVLAFRPLIIEYLVLLVFIIYFFFEVIQNSVTEPIYQKAIFWISVAFIINFSGNFFLLLTSLNSFNDPSFRDTFIIMNGSITILKNVLLCVAVSLKEKNNADENADQRSIDSGLSDFLPFNNQN